MFYTFLFRQKSFIGTFTLNLDANSIYTVRPTGFWMDKILQHESKKPITNCDPLKPRKLIDRTVRN